MSDVETNTVSEAVTKKRTVEEVQKEKILNLLAELGGGLTSDDDITFEGSKLVLPETMTPVDAINFLESHIEQNEAQTSMVKQFRYRPWDGAHATQAALKKMFGTVGVGKATFFGMIPPTLVEINTGTNTTEQVPWGRIEVSMIEGVIDLGGSNDKELGPLFSVSVTTKRKYRSHVQGLFAAIQDELEHNSIYKEKAIDGQDKPEFLELSTLDETSIVFSDDVMTQLNANVWSLLENTDQMEALGLPLKRAVLLEGPYGTGKTSAAFITAKKAVENGWTFLYCRPGRDSLSEVMQTARLYQPAVVFFEDVDTISSTGDADDVTRLLDLFDGINAKGTKLMAVMTTNHVERIHRGMVRPGRLDAVIHIGALDQNGVTRMIERLVPKDMRGTLDYSAIYSSMEGFLPAYVREAIDRAIRYSLVRNGGTAKKVKLETQDFIDAADGLRPQLALMIEAAEGETEPTLDRALREAVADVMHGAEFRDLSHNNPVSSYEADYIAVRGTQNGYRKAKV